MPTILVSVLLVLIGGYFSSKLAERVKMPPMLGMMVFSILMGPSVFGLLS